MQGIVIFARMSSKRLPKKMLQKIGSRSLFVHIIDRIQKIKNKQIIILATSKNKSDDALVAEGKKRNIEIYRGDLSNVVKRAYECCKKFNLDSLVRICGDRLFLDFKDIDKAIQKFNNSKKKIDLASNLLRGNIPPGKTIEIIRKSALHKILKKTKSRSHLEHVTTYIYNNKKKFRLFKLKKPTYSNYNFSYSIDTYNDLKRAKFVNSKIKNITNAKNDQIFSLTKKWYQSEKKNN